MNESVLYVPFKALFGEIGIAISDGMQRRIEIISDIR